MSEIEKATDDAPAAEAAPAPASADATADAELDLAVIEGLAEEDRALPPSRDSAVPDSAWGAPAEHSLSLLEAMQSLGELVARRLDGLQTIFERELRAEATRERVIDRLHAELQDYKQDFLLKIQRPIFVDLVQLHDDIAKMIDAKPVAGDEPERALDLRGALESVQTAIEDILYRQGVEPFVVEGSAFDPRRQRAVSTVPTGDPALNKTVAARHRKGFAAADKLIRPEIVTVYTWRPSPPAASG